MPPKRSRTEGSSSAPPRQYDHSKFISAEAADRFDEFITGKALTPERGLRPERGVDGEIWEQIDERVWDTFTHHPDPAVVPVVQEFYANAQDRQPFEVTVRGRRVPFSAQAINDYYNLVPPAVCQYTEFIRSQPDYDKMVAELCKPGTTWITKRDRGASLFPSKDLSLYGKIWYAFLSAKLMPSQHVSDVSKEKAALLYAIVMDFSIDVGNIIEGSIRRLLRGNVQGGLPHPSLICGLCRQAGVQWRDDEVTQQPSQILDHRLIARYKVWDGAESHPRGRGFIIAAASDDEEDDEQPPASSSQPKAKFSSQLRSLQLLVDRRAKRLEKQNQRIAERQEHMWNFTSSFSAALTAQFPNAPVPFPVPTPLPTFPPSDSDGEDTYYQPTT